VRPIIAPRVKEFTIYIRLDSKSEGDIFEGPLVNKMMCMIEC